MRALTRRLRSRYSSHDWRPYDSGSGASTFRLDGRPPLYAKVARVSRHPDPRSDLSREAARISWLAGTGFPAPEVVEAGEEGGIGWLVMTAVPGRSAAEPWPAERRFAVIDAVADILRDLHALPAAECPFDRTLDVTLQRARRAMREGLVDEGAMAVDGWKRDLDFPALVAELEATRPKEEQLVVCHGDYCLPNVMIDPATCAPTGLVDLGRLGRADRWSDLALMSGSIGSESLNPQYGEEHVIRFLTRFGADPSDPRLSYYRRLDSLF